VVNELVDEFLMKSIYYLVWNQLWNSGFSLVRSLAALAALSPAVRCVLFEEALALLRACASVPLACSWPCSSSLMGERFVLFDRSRAVDPAVLIVVLGAVRCEMCCHLCSSGLLVRSSCSLKADAVCCGCFWSE